MDSPMLDFTGWISATEAANRLGIGVDRVAQLRREHRLDILETPIGNLINEASVERYRAERAAWRAKRPPKDHSLQEGFVRRPSGGPSEPA